MLVGLVEGGKNRKTKKKKKKTGRKPTLKYKEKKEKKTLEPSHLITTHPFIPAPLHLPSNNRNQIRNALFPFPTTPSRFSSIIEPACPPEPADTDGRPECDESTLEIEVDIKVKVPPSANLEIMALFSYPFPDPLTPPSAGLGAKVMYLSCECE